MKTLMSNISSIALAVLITGMALVGCLNSAGPDTDESSPYFQNKNPGISANDFLADSTFTELLVEIDYMEGYRPNQQALDSLKAFLERRLNKRSVTIMTPTVIPSGNQQSYSANDIRILEEEHRDEFTESTSENRLTAYMIIVDGSYSQRNVLGIAYYNTSNAFFGAAYDEASGAISQPSRYLIESISFRHEFGHLFGLVNIPGSGTDMQQDHQDDGNGHHCDNNRCLMYYAMEATDLIGQIIGEDIPALDQNCILDLQANGGS